MSTLKTNNIQHVDRSEPSILIDTSGSVSIAGTLTYEDVTNVDSVGIITARGLSIFGNTTGLQVASGISTFQAVTGTTGTFTGGIDVTSNVTISDSIVHSGDTNTKIRFPTADTFTVETSGSERLRITSGGLVGVGQATPTHMLHVDSSNASDSTATAFFKGRIIRFDGAASSDSPRLNFSLDGTDKAQILCHRTALGLDITTLVAEPIKFKINGSERLRITSGGLIGIGTDSPAGDLDIRGQTGTDSSRIYLISGDAADSSIYFGSINDTATGALRYEHTDDSLRIYGYNNTERLRVLSDGQLKHTAASGSTIITFQRTDTNTSGAVGVLNFAASDDHSVANIQVLGDGDNEGAHIVFKTTTAAASADPYNAATVERLRITSDGKVGINEASPQAALDVEGDGVPIVINSSNSNTYKIQFKNAGSTLGYIGAVTDAIVFSNSSAAEQARFTDAGLKLPSGRGIDFSATGQASGMSNELLDDYEEGTWTPSYGSSSVTSSTYANTVGYYTLIGNLVTFTGRIQMTNSTVNGNPITMGGFPFTAGPNPGQQGGFDITYIDNWYSGTSTTNAQVTFLISGGQSYGYFYNGDGSTIAANATYDSARRTLHFKGHYFI